MLAAVSQGVVLGALLQGVNVQGRAYAGGWWDRLTPFSLLTGVNVPSAYALLGELYPAEALSVFGLGGLPADWQLMLKQTPLPPEYVLGFVGAGLVFVVGPFVSEY